MLRGTLLFLVLCSAPLHAAAQAWVRPAGGAYIKLSQGRTTTSEQYRADGTIGPYDPAQPNDDVFFDRSLFLYSEVGLADRLTGVLQLSYRTIEVITEGDSRTARAPGDVSLGVRYALRPMEKVSRTGTSAVVSGSVSIPSGYARNLTPSVGAGQVDAELGTAIGQSLYPIPGYIQGGVGIRFRSNIYGFSDAVECLSSAATESRDSNCIPDDRPDYDAEWLFQLEGGLSLDRVLIQGIMHGIWSNLPPETDFDPQNPIPTRRRILKTGFGLTVYPYKTAGVSVQLFTTPVGRNTIRSTDLFFGLEMRFGE